MSYDSELEQGEKLSYDEDEVIVRIDAWYEAPAWEGDLTYERNRWGGYEFLLQLENGAFEYFETIWELDEYISDWELKHED